MTRLIEDEKGFKIFKKKLAKIRREMGISDKER
jgi:hypothetical protein